MNWVCDQNEEWTVIRVLDLLSGFRRPGILKDKLQFWCRVDGFYGCEFDKGSLSRHQGDRICWLK